MICNLDPVLLNCLGEKASDSCCHSRIWEESDDSFNRPASDQEPEKHMVGGQILLDKMAH